MKTQLIILVVLVLVATVLARAKNSAKPVAKRLNCKKGTAVWTACVNGSMKQTFTPTDAGCGNATEANLPCPSVMNKEKKGCTLTRTDAIQECATGTNFTRTYSATGTCGAVKQKPVKKLPCSKMYKSSADRDAQKAAKKAEKLAKKGAKKDKKMDKKNNKNKRVQKDKKAAAGGNA